MNQTPNNHEDPRLAELLEVIFKFAAGDLTARGTLSDDDSALDGVMAGINILGEELEAQVAANKQAQQALSESEDQLRAVFNAVQDGILVADVETKRFRMANASICRMLGYRLDELIDLAVEDIHPEESRPDVVRQFELQLKGESSLATLPVKRKDGTVFYADVNAAPVTLDGRFYLIGVFRDITERKRAEEQLRRASLYARSLIEASLDPLVTISLEGKIMDVNEAAAQGTGMPRGLLIGSDFSTYFTDPDMAHAGYQEAFTKGTVRNYPLTMRHASGKLTEVLYNASVYRNETGEVAGVLVVARDLTERKRAEQAEELASRDGLTTLYNHRTFHSLLEDEIARTRRFRRPVSVLMLDIDHFKHVNDTYGHQTGDVILKSLSGLLVKQARAVDRVCRYGGEEFTVILPETETPMAMQIAERLRTEVERQPFDIGGGKTINIAVSIGVATYPQQASSLEGLVKATDVALYAAKQGGRNRVICYEAKMAGKDWSA